MRTIVRSTIAMVAATAVVAIAFTVSDADARRGGGSGGVRAAGLAGSYYYNNYDNSSYNNCSAPYYGGSSYSGCDYSSYAYSPSYGDGYDYASSGSGYNPYFRRTFWGGSRRFGW